MPIDSGAGKTKTRVYNHLRDAILSGEMQPGDPLTEIGLVELLGTSRTPIREALRELSFDGLTEKVGRGYRVTKPDLAETFQFYRIRILLEGEVCRQAAESRTEVDLAILEGLVQRDRGLVDPDDRTRMMTNLEFHDALYDATHSRVLSGILRRLATQQIHAPHSTLSFPGRWEETLEEHVAIVAAVRDRRGDDARDLMQEHMAEAQRIRIQLLRDSFQAPESAQQ